MVLQERSADVSTYILFKLWGLAVTLAQRVTRGKTPAVWQLDGRSKRNGWRARQEIVRRDRSVKEDKDHTGWNKVLTSTLHAIPKPYIIYLSIYYISFQSQSQLWMYVFLQFFCTCHSNLVQTLIQFLYEYFSANLTPLHPQDTMHTVMTPHKKTQTNTRTQRNAQTGINNRKFLNRIQQIVHILKLPLCFIFFHWQWKICIWFFPCGSDNSCWSQ